MKLRITCWKEITLSFWTYCQLIIQFYLMKAAKSCLNYKLCSSLSKILGHIFDNYLMISSAARPSSSGELKLNSCKNSL